MLLDKNFSQDRTVSTWIIMFLRAIVEHGLAPLDAVESVQREHDIMTHGEAQYAIFHHTRSTDCRKSEHPSIGFGIFTSRPHKTAPRIGRRLRLLLRNRSVPSRRTAQRWIRNKWHARPTGAYCSRPPCTVDSLPPRSGIPGKNATATAITATT